MPDLDLAPNTNFSSPTVSLPALPAQQSFSRRWIWLGALGLVAAVALAYGNAFKVPFIFDDEGSILSNDSIHSWRTMLFPRGDTGDTVGGRPLLNVSLALNYAISGTNVWSYHLVNILIHLVSGLALFGLVRRTLAGRGVTGLKWVERDAFFCALAASALWMLHPLQTESVTYIVQRAESFVSMWYLLTLYCFARWTEVARASSPCGSMGFQPMSPGNTGAGMMLAPPKTCGRDVMATCWLPLSIVCCALGMASKEVMVSAPVMVFLYDRAFVAGSFKAAWRARWKFYLVLCATWLVLAACLLYPGFSAWLHAPEPRPSLLEYLRNSGFRGGTTGYGTPVTWWMYAITQCKAILIYLKLVFWPAPLVFDYGVFFIVSPSLVWPQITVVVLLVAAALFAMFRFPRAGIFGALFFAVLAPSSSFIPVVSQTMAEHRMYLPLAAIIVPLVVACWWFARTREEPLAKVSALAVFAAIAVAFGVLVWQRNQVFQSVVSIWDDTVKKVPSSHRAQNNIGCALIDAKRYEEGIPYCLEATRLKPDYGEAYGNVGYGLSGEKKFTEAIPYYEKALYFMRKIGLTNLDRVLLNFGLALHEVGRDTEARAAFEEAVSVNPKNAPSLNNLGNYEFLAGRYAEAKKFYQRAVESDPTFAEAWYDLGNAVIALGEPWGDAEQHYRHALQLSPDLTLAQDNLARLLLAMNRPREAADYFAKVVKDTPAPNATMQLNAARAFMQSGKTTDAIPLLEALIQQDPNNIEANYLLGNARYRMGDRDGAMTSYRQAIRINPFAVEPHGNLGSLLAAAGQWDEAIAELNAALRLKPDYAEAHQNLANALVQQNRDDEARKHYEEAIRLKPEMAQARYNYARLLVRLGEIEAAREQLKKAIDLRPDYTDAIDFLKTLP